MPEVMAKGIPAWRNYPAKMRKKSSGALTARTMALPWRSDKRNVGATPAAVARADLPRSADGRRVHSVSRRFLQIVRLRSPGIPK